MKLLSWLRVRVSRRPVSAHSGRKEFIEAIGCGISSGGRSPFRGHGSALTRCSQHSLRVPTLASFATTGDPTIGETPRNVKMHRHSHLRAEGRVDHAGLTANGQRSQVQ